MRYSIFCCDMIAMKREVAAERQVFRGANVKLGNWRQVTVRINIYENGSRNNWESKEREYYKFRYARRSVQSPLVVLI